MPPPRELNYNVLELPKAVIRDTPEEQDPLYREIFQTQVWDRPDSYIVHQGKNFYETIVFRIYKCLSEKTQEELDEAVEYDMDSEDEVWLSEFNKERRRKGLIPLSEDDFEYMIDRLEKESFNHVKLFAPNSYVNDI